MSLRKKESKMKKRNKRVKSAIISMELSTFEIPPSGDILVLGKTCPIGPQASKRMLDTVAPNQFELVQPEGKKTMTGEEFFRGYKKQLDLKKFI